MFSNPPPVPSQGPSMSNNRKPRPNAPAAYGHGHYVGVRINKYETKAQARARGQGNTGMIHPAVVLAGPDASNRYDIATISSEHPDCPPRAPLNTFHPMTTITGDISFYQRNVAHSDLRPWIDEHTGGITQPMSQMQLARLRGQMIIQPPQLPPNGGYFPAVPISVGNRPWGGESPYPQQDYSARYPSGPSSLPVFSSMPVYGQQHMSHPPFPHPSYHQNAHMSSSFPPSHGQLYPPPIPQEVGFGYAAHYRDEGDHGRPLTTGTTGRPAVYVGQDSTYYWYPPPGKSVGDQS